MARTSSIKAFARSGKRCPPGSMATATPTISSRRTKGLSHAQRASPLVT